MNSTADSVYIVANLHSSKEDYFPDNTADDFRTKLSKPLLLGNGEWTVALCEIRLVNVLVGKKESGTSVTTVKETLGNDKRKNKRGLTREEKGAYLQVDFAHCEGLIIRGQPSHSLRIVPYEPDRLRIFTQPFYVPVRTGYIDTFRVRVRVDSDTPLKIQQHNDTCITCTLHFKKANIGNHVF